MWISPAHWGEQGAGGFTTLSTLSRKCDFLNDFLRLGTYNEWAFLNDKGHRRMDGHSRGVFFCTNRAARASLFGIKIFLYFFWDRGVLPPVCKYWLTSQQFEISVLMVVFEIWWNRDVRVKDTYGWFACGSYCFYRCGCKLGGRLGCRYFWP